MAVVTTIQAWLKEISSEEGTVQAENQGSEERADRVTTPATRPRERLTTGRHRILINATVGVLTTGPAKVGFEHSLLGVTYKLRLILLGCRTPEQTCVTCLNCSVSGDEGIDVCI
jgi:hypothetical protein